MTWTKLGDEFPDHCWRLSDAAFRLHVEGLAWSNRRHLDGWLDKSEMRLWAKRPDAANELVSEGWWQDCDDRFLIVYHLGWQRTAEQWLHQSTVNKANRAMGKRRPVRPKDESSHESSDESSEEMDWTGRDRTGLEERGTSLKPSAKKKEPQHSGLDSFDSYRERAHQDANPGDYEATIKRNTDRGYE